MLFRSWDGLRQRAQAGGRGGQGREAGSGEGEGGEDKVKPAVGTARTERVHGQAGDGPDVKKVFSDAARKGFAREGWRQVFVDYSEVAQEMLDKEHLPKGKRAWVLRYFRDIRPR